jgi:hypothetical protein
MRFRIDFKDPETQEPRTEYVDAEAAPGLWTERERAEDIAYNLADKGRYTITPEPTP